MDTAGARHTTFLLESHIIGYPDHFVQTPARRPMNFVGDMINERCWGAKTVGVEMDAYYFTALKDHDRRRAHDDSRGCAAAGAGRKSGAW